MNLLDLPEDVLSIVLLLLQPHEFLIFCSVSKAVYEQYRLDPLYWRTKAASTFRLPISPLLAADGRRWYWLYKRLKTQTRLFTWGRGVRGNLGPGRAIPRLHYRGVPIRIGGPRQVFQRVESTWPTETHVSDEVGVISDLQCGGWSTTLLSSAGRLYTTGSLDSMNGFTVGETAQEFTRLEYLTQSTSAIRQFSSGRRHVLALTDDGEILSWDRVNAKGYKIFSKDGRSFGGKPSRVVAGWSKSSAYVPDTGIVYWDPVKNDHRDEELDGMHVREKVIPHTARQSTENNPVEILKHVVLSEYIIWITSQSELFAYRYEENDNKNNNATAIPQAAVQENLPFEIPGYASGERELKDLQGQFETFGVFTATGEVLAGNVEYLRQCEAKLRNNIIPPGADDSEIMAALLASKPDNVPALQHTGVIALAYGDYHYQALHANGMITTYGTDSQGCGSLGLGGASARFRGLRRDPRIPGDFKLLPIAQRRGRHIWFEHEKRDWLNWLEDTLKEPSFKYNDEPAIQIWENSPERQAAFSEWIEQEGQHWEDGPFNYSVETSTSNPTSTKAVSSDDYDHLGAYFTIGIAAAGWHSGALVLVDDEARERTRQKWITELALEAQPTVPGAFESPRDQPDTEYVWKLTGFPKVQLPDGFVMPGESETTMPWRDAVPSMHELGLNIAQGSS